MEQHARARTSELICIPFLDSSTTPSEREAIATELRRRGFGRIAVLFLRILAGLGLWWNLIAWEWATLDLSDVLFGYAINSGLVALVATVIAAFRLLTGASLVPAGLTALASSLLCLAFWLSARRGWARRRQESESMGAAV
jgi:apolipoprotein N-acyltransferase